MSADLDQIEVVAGILWRDGLCLATSRPEGGRHVGLWEFPGGKIEPGEALEAALVRELVEELDVVPLVCEHWLTKRHVYPDYAVVLHFFHVTVFEREPRPREGQSLRWIDPALGTAGCPDLTFVPADVEVVEALARLAGEGNSE